MLDRLERLFIQAESERPADLPVHAVLCDRARKGDSTFKPGQPSLFGVIRFRFPKRLGSYDAMADLINAGSRRLVIGVAINALGQSVLVLYPIRLADEVEDCAEMDMRLGFDPCWLEILYIPGVLVVA
jgi:hypothetical protein